MTITALGASLRVVALPVSFPMSGPVRVASAARVAFGRRAVPFAGILKPGERAWMAGTGDDLFAEPGDDARFPDVSGTGASHVAACVRTRS